MRFVNDYAEYIFWRNKDSSVYQNWRERALKLMWRKRRR